MSQNTAKNKEPRYVKSREKNLADANRLYHNFEKNLKDLKEQIVRARKKLL